MKVYILKYWYWEDCSTHGVFTEEAMRQKRMEFAKKQKEDNIPAIKAMQKTIAEKDVKRKEFIRQAEIEIKYEGYIKKAVSEAEKMLEYENIKIPENIDYSTVINLASEARQKLNEIRPISVGQAMRISGVNPSDITMLLMHLKKES